MFARFFKYARQSPSIVPKLYSNRTFLSTRKRQNFLDKFAEMGDKNVLFLFFGHYAAGNRKLLVLPKRLFYFLGKMRAGYYGLIARNCFVKAFLARFIQFGKHVVKQKNGVFALFFAVKVHFGKF